MAITISVANQKGGVGKTTSAINLAACLAASGRPTLLVDLDPQGNATSGVGVSPSSLERSVFDVLAGDIPAREAIIETNFDNLYLVPANVDLSSVEMALMDSEDRLTRLRGVLEPVKHDFAYIIIDSPPSLSLLALNVLAAADSAIVPVQCEYYSLEGLTSLLQTFRRVRESVNPEIEILGVLMTMYDGRTNLAQQVVEDVRNAFGDSVFKTLIPRTVKLSEAPSFGKPIIFYDINSSGSEAYIRFCQEVLDRVEENRVGQGAGRPAGDAGSPGEGIVAGDASATAGSGGNDSD